MNSRAPIKEIQIYPKPETVPDKNNPRPNSDPYAFTPFKKTLKERQQEFLKICIQRYGGTLIGEIARACSGKKGAVSDEIIDLYVTRLNERYDCADFFAVHVVHALYINKKYPFLTLVQTNKLNQALLDFKYWVDEPGHNYMIMYTENHQILFHSLEYLAGQLFQTQTFTNNGRTGEWHQNHAKTLALTWMERRARWGFSEWSSNEYFAEDIEALVILAEFAEDEDLAKSAAIILDLMLFEIASNQFYGFHGSTHGRAYENETLSGWDCDIASSIKIIWGLGTFGEDGYMAALTLACATKYIPPDIIIRMGQQFQEEFINYERNGIALENLGKYGISTKNLEDATFLWGMGAFSLPEVIDLFVKACDTWNLWTLPFFDFLGDKHSFLPRNGSLGKITKKIKIDFNRALLGEVNMITFRTHDYMLSTAQDYRPGEMGYQHHIWQATLSPNAIVFTTNPGATVYTQESISPDKLEYKYEQKNGERPQLNRLPSYWAGQNRLPRAAQYKNLCLIIYNIKMKKATGESVVYDFTHIFFPRWAFDEVHEEQGWIFGKVKKGYIAIYSALPYIWKDTKNPFIHDVIIHGIKNIYICLMGNYEQYGSFTQFQQKVLEGALSIDLKLLKIEFTCPKLGHINFSWDGPLLIDKKEIALSNYKRISNHYCESEFDSGLYVIEQGGERLTLDIKRKIRRIESLNNKK